MRIDAAPLEGLTGASWRRVHARFFGGIDRYYSPFFFPTPDPGIAPKDLKQILPEENPGLKLIPQMLVSSPDSFFKAEETLLSLGFEEVNLNFGCPSATVVPKGRGAGMLADPEKCDRFLDAVFSRAKIRVSVKTRIGLDDTDEFPELLEIFNRYPIFELIIHPRLGREMYTGIPHRDVFDYAYREAKMPLVYNGDLFTPAQMKEAVERWPEVRALMIGRGLLCNPGLAEEFAGGGRVRKERLKEYHDAYLAENAAILSGEAHLLPRMKEQWSYLRYLFTEPEKPLKKILKSKNLAEYRAAVNAFFAECAVGETTSFADREK